MLHRIASCAAGLAVIVALSSSSLSGQGGPADIPYPATVTFNDDDAYRITSDGRGSYTNGGSTKMEVAFHSVTGDLVMRGSTGSNPRRLVFDLSGKVSGPGPIGVIQDELFMNIRDILTMVSGESRNTIAIFRPSIGVFRFDPADGATLVHVVRLGQTWTVTADSSNEPFAGDIAVLRQTQKGKTVIAGLYHLPFAITAECPTCPL